MTRCKMAQPDDRRNIPSKIEFLFNKENHTNDSSNSVPESRTKEAGSADKIIIDPLLGLSMLDCTTSKNIN